MLWGIRQFSSYFGTIMKRKLKVLVLIVCALALGSYLYFKKERGGANPAEHVPICISDNELYPSFCSAAARDEAEFQNFKRSPIYNLVQEYSTYEEGHDYLVQILSKYPFLLDKLAQFRKNDSLGNPQVFNYPFVGLFSPSTLRYMKVAGDLKKHFGDLNGFKVIEIGGAYGGQCKILSDLFHFQSYTIVDLPECLELAKKYLEKQEIDGIKYCAPNNVSNSESYDLVISNYSFTEYKRDYQQKIVQKIFKSSKNGYLTCNFYPKHFGVKSLSKDELINALSSLALELEELPEEPLTGKDNFILTWKKNAKGGF
jgi:putative sugar O-methyltransferase